MTRLAAIGSGCVGLPLVVEFAEQLRIFDLDLAEQTAAACQSGTDRSRELIDAEVQTAMNAFGTDDARIAGGTDFIVVGAPKLVDDADIPDCEFLMGASASADRHPQNAAIVNCESDVYAGSSEEACIAGYSRERINPSDHEPVPTKILISGPGDTQTGGCGHEAEHCQVQVRPSRWPLHRRRPVPPHHEDESLGYHPQIYAEMVVGGIGHMIVEDVVSIDVKAALEPAANLGNGVPAVVSVTVARFSVMLAVEPVAAGAHPDVSVLVSGSLGRWSAAANPRSQQPTRISLQARGLR
jgi:hypothetical protein